MFVYLGQRHTNMDIVLHLSRGEQDLVSACMRHERWAQKLLYEEHYSKMMAVCLRYASSSDDAMDIMHEGFIKVFRHIAKYQPGTSLAAWMRKIMVNTAIDYYRKNIDRKSVV